MDSLVRAAFLQGVRTLASGSKAKQKKVFPMLASAFQSTVLLPNRPKGADLNLKKSSYKKLGVLLQAMAEVSDPSGLMTTFRRNFPTRLTFV